MKINRIIRECTTLAVLLVIIAVSKSFAVSASGTDTLDYCLKFDGRDDVINAGDIYSFDSAQEFTVEMWVRIDEFKPWRTFFCKFQDLGNRIQFQQYRDSGKIALCVNNKADIRKKENQAYFFTPEPEVTIGDWFHLAMVFNGKLDNENRLKLYINGMARQLKKDASATGEVPSYMPSTTAPLLLGAETGTGAYGYRGLMDEVRIWTVARSDDEIRTYMNRSLQGNENGLQMYYKMAKSEVFDNVKIKDQSLYRNDATLVNLSADSCFVERDVAIPALQSASIKVEQTNNGAAAIAWKRGSGSSNIVFASESDTSMPQLSTGTSYTADSSFGKGSRAGESNWYCIYNGNEANAVLLGLKPSTMYRIAVIDYNGGKGEEHYLNKLSDQNMISLTTADGEKKTQTITFDSIPVAEPGKSYSLKAAASSGLVISFASKDSSVAVILDGQLKIKSPGVTAIVASQKGGEAYLPAPDVTRILSVELPKISLPVNEPVVNVTKVTSWWKRRPVIFGAGGAFVAGLIVAAIVASHNDDGATAAADRPPNDPILSK